MSDDQLPTTALSLGACASLPELAARYLEEYMQKIELAVADLSDDEIWWRPQPHANAIGNLLLHLHGNLSLWIRQSLDGLPFERDRAGEFLAHRSHDKEMLLALLGEAVEECERILRELAADDLDREITVQGYDTDRFGVIFHATEHMSYHTGQIIALAKLMTQPDTVREFYPRHLGE